MECETHSNFFTKISSFRIWETRTWSAEIWDVMDGHIQAAAWSPCGTKAIFADSVHPILYCVDKVGTTELLCITLYAIPNFILSELLNKSRDCGS
jgi:hypothetical protein